MTNAETVESVIEHLRRRAQGYQDAIIPRERLKVGLNQADYTLTVEGTEMPLTKSGNRSLCRLLGMNQRYFERYPSRAEFAEHANTHIGQRPAEGLLVRMEEGKVRAILPKSYKIYDDHQVFNQLHDQVQALGQKVDLHQRGANGTSIYRLVYGNAHEKDEVLLMVEIKNSEVGSHSLEIVHGLYRVVCTNGATRPVKEWGFMRWSHRGNPDRIPALLHSRWQEGITHINEMQTAFEATRQRPLGKMPTEIVQGLVESKRMSKRFGDKIAEQLNQRPGEEYPLSYFSLVNAITKEAQNLPSLDQQSRMEALGMELALQVAK